MEAGSDITSLFFLSDDFCLAASPEVESRACKKDIDEVISSDRSPRFEDFDNLPRIGAIIKEVSVPGSAHHQLSTARMRSRYTDSDPSRPLGYLMHQ